MGKDMIFMGIAFELVGLCAGGYYFGEVLSEKMGWPNAPAYLVAILFIGWFVHLIYLLQRFEKEDADKNSKT